MTTEEAIKILNDTPVEISSGSKTTTREYSQMLHLAENALEKQIPKKPKGVTDPMFGDVTLSCPRCDNINLAHPFGCKGYDYCPGCGQALDWSETE